MPRTPYRVGIVGASGIAVGVPEPPHPPFRKEVPISHAAALALLPNVDLVAVCDLLPTLLDDFKSVWRNEWPNTNTYTDYREMLKRENLDILAVATPDHKHTDIVVDGANAGVQGILCEKPLATTLNDVDQMIQTCAECGIPIHVDHSRRWNPLFHKVRQELRSGLIGPLSTIVAYQGGPRAMLFRNGTHTIDAVCFFAESDPVQVFGKLEEGFEYWDRYMGDGGKLPENDPSASGLILFKNGVRALYNSSKETSTVSHTMQLMGRRGQISLNMDGRSATAVIEQPDSGIPTTHTIHAPQYQIQGLPAAYAELIDIMETGGTGISTATEARKTIQIILGFLRSEQEGNKLVGVPG